MNTRTQIFASGVFVSMAALGATSVQAQAYPDPCASVRIIVPYAPGGSADISARIVAERLTVSLKKNVVVENRPGATGNIGNTAVAKAAPDGCMLLVNGTVIATFVHSFPDLAFDPYRDLVPVGGIAITPTVIVAPMSNPANTVADLVKASKARPEGLAYAVAGYGLQQHLVVEEISLRTGGKFTYVAYKGAGGTGMTDLISGRVDFASFLAGTTTGFIRDGKLKLLAVVQARRSAWLPDAPTTAEQGFPGLYGGVHFLLFAPGATPKATVAVLDSQLRAIVADAAVKERFVKIGFETTPMSSDEASAEMRKIGDAMGPVIKRLGIKLK
jgi:tripartite-type tricarboxylate transporter receptor subunit TctC